MNISGRREKTGLTKVQIELLMYVWLLEDDSFSLSSLTSRFPMSLRTVQRYIRDLTLCRALPGITLLNCVKIQEILYYCDDCDPRSFIKDGLGIYDSHVPPEILNPVEEKISHARDEYDSVNHYLDYRQFSDEEHLLHLHRLLCLFRLNEERFCGYIALHAGETEYNGVRFSSNYDFYCDDEENEDADNAGDENQEEESLTPEELSYARAFTGASEKRKALQEALQLPPDAFTLRTVQRYLKEIREVCDAYVQIRKKRDDWFYD